MLNSIKTLKRYCKATLNMFFDKKNLMMTKVIYLYDRFLESNRNFMTEHVKIVKIPDFFCLNCQFPDFPGKVTTLNKKAVSKDVFQ